MHHILAVNPGSTTTKVALFEEEAEVSGDVFRHDAADLRSCGKLWDQLELRWQAVHGWTSGNVRELSAVVATGGLFRPLVGGTYAVNERMLSDARANLQGEHASNLGCALAHRLASAYGCNAYVVDPVSVDEFEPLARYSGHPLDRTPQPVARDQYSCDGTTRRHATRSSAGAEFVDHRAPGRRHLDCALYEAAASSMSMTPRAMVHFRRKGLADCLCNGSSTSVSRVRTRKARCASWSWAAAG